MQVEKKRIRKGTKTNTILRWGSGGKSGQWTVHTKVAIAPNIFTFLLCRPLSSQVEWQQVPWQLLQQLSLHRLHQHQSLGQQKLTHVHITRSRIAWWCTTRRRGIHRWCGYRDTGHCLRRVSPTWRGVVAYGQTYLEQRTEHGQGNYPLPNRANALLPTSCQKWWLHRCHVNWIEIIKYNVIMTGGSRNHWINVISIMFGGDTNAILDGYLQDLS